jgi:hypothetical protein
MSAIGPKRTSLVALHMTAFGGEADMDFCGAKLWYNICWTRSGGAHVPAPFDRIFRHVDLRDVSRMWHVSTRNRSDEGHSNGKDDASRQGGEDARMRKAGGGTKN